MKTSLLLTLVLAIACLTVHAERNDSFQPTTVRALDHFTDMVSNKTILNGDVEIVRGTLLIRAEYAEMRKVFAPS